jgi:hypothetical protein
LESLGAPSRFSCSLFVLDLRASNAKSASDATVLDYELAQSPYGSRAHDRSWTRPPDRYRPGLKKRRDSWKTSATWLEIVAHPVKKPLQGKVVELIPQERQRLANLETMLKKMEKAKELELLPTVSAEHVEAFEGRHGIRLPGQYRAFITQIANGIRTSGA